MDLTETNCNAFTRSRKKCHIGKTGSINQQQHSQRTLVLHLPIFYNPDASGYRRPIESYKLRKTKAEIRRYFSGYSMYSLRGWYIESKTREQYHDVNIRFEIDGEFDVSKLIFLARWKLVLESRFRQESVYMKLTAPFSCL